MVLPGQQYHLGFIKLVPSRIALQFLWNEYSVHGSLSEVLTNWQVFGDSIVSRNITVLSGITASISSSTGTMLPVGGSTTLDAGSGYASYLWNNQSTGQTLDTDQPGTYSVIVTAPSGCTATASITLTQASSVCPQFNQPMPPGDSCQAAPSFCANFLNGYCSSNIGYTTDTPGNLASISPCTLENNQSLNLWPALRGHCTVCFFGKQLPSSYGLAVLCLANHGLPNLYGHRQLHGCDRRHD